MTQICSIGCLLRVDRDNEPFFQRDRVLAQVHGSEHSEVSGVGHSMGYHLHTCNFFLPEFPIA
jgi:hypothetical protein